MSDSYNYSYEPRNEYCYPGTNILVNKLNLRDAASLHDAERNITFLRTLDFMDLKHEGAFNFEHLKAIHRHIFSDIYDWAGEMRRGEFLTKGGTIFCRGQFLESMAADIFKKLHNEHELKGLEKTEFISRLAYFMAEINVLHPFREGNGRVAREFFRQLSANAGFELDFSNTGKAELLDADVKAFYREYNPLIAILDSAVSHIQ